MHSERLCTSPAGITARKALGAPRRPCRFCKGSHWDIDCKDLSSQKPRPGGIPLSSPQKTSARAALFTQGPLPSGDSDQEEVDYQYLWEQDHRMDGLVSGGQSDFEPPLFPVESTTPM